MDPTAIPGFPPTPTYPSLDVMLMKYGVLIIVIQLAVTQVKALIRTDLRTKPWPLIACILVGLSVYGWELYAIETIFQHAATTGHAGVMRFVDWFVTTAFGAGGTSSIVGLIKAKSRFKREAAAAAA